MIKKLLILAFGLRLFLSFGPYHPDLGNHLDWGIKFWQVGPKNFYENTFWQVSWANQPPGTIYLFALMRKIYEVIFAVFWWLNLKIPVFPSNIIPFLENKLYISLVKLPSILADLGISCLIYRFILKLKNQKTANLAALIFLFNPVVWYNSAVWGQTDSIISFFGLWAVYLFWRQKPFQASFVYFLSLYFKGSLLIFFPIVFILLFKSRISWRKKIIALLVPILILAYLSFPFVKWMEPLPWLYHLYRDRIFSHQGNMLTANAFNFWALLFGIDFTRNDLGLFLGLSLKTWGQILFGLTLLPVLAGLFFKKVEIKLALWSLAVVSLTSFIFLTNMHERYLFPAFPYLTIMIFLFPNLKSFYLILSLIFWLNLYHLWYIPDFFGLRLIYSLSVIRTFSLINLFLTFWFLFCYFRFLRPKKL